MSSALILWVQDEYDGPINGIAEFCGEKLWFSRMDTVPLTEIAVLSTEENISSSNTQRVYVLYRLTDEMMEAVTNNHLLHCEETGAPKNHGDPIQIRRKQKVSKMKPEVMERLIPDGQDVEKGIEAEHRPLAGVKTYGHKIIPSSVTGEIVKLLLESEFTNYFVPRCCELVEY